MISNSTYPRKYINCNSTYKVEIKVKEKGKPWEEIEEFVVIDTEESKQEKAARKAAEIAAGLAEFKKTKVRWCFIGIEQGHYEHPENWGLL